MGQGSGIAMSCGVHCRQSSYPTDTSPIQPLAWGPPYAMGEALRRKMSESRQVLMKSQQDFLRVWIWEKIPTWVFCHFSIGFFGFELYELFIYFGDEALVSCIVCEDFSPIVGGLLSL